MTEKILITVKTYPTLSKKYAELVCTAGITESGEWRRLYPVRFRQLYDEQKYSKYQWVEAKIEKSVVMLNDDERNHNMLVEFNSIIHTITTSVSREMIKNELEKRNFRYFYFGFGGSHFWLKQKNIRTKDNNEIRINPDVRILIANC